jgi:hypothetical protein
MCAHVRVSNLRAVCAERRKRRGAGRKRLRVDDVPVNHRELEHRRSLDEVLDVRDRKKVPSRVDEKPSVRISVGGEHAGVLRTKKKDSEHLAASMADDDI